MLFSGRADLFSKGSPVRVSAFRAFCLAGAIGAFVLLVPRASSGGQWISYSSNHRNILEGNWQSCLDRSGRYTERVYDHVVAGVGQYEVHLGPRREFAIFQGVQDEHRDHDSPDNLLKPYRLDVEGNLAKHEWKIPSLDLVFTATLSGGSRGDCESWYVLLEPSAKHKPS